MDKNAHYKIGKAAELAGVNKETIRYYERRNLIPEPERMDSCYRLFSRRHVDQIRFIKRAQELGFTLSEIDDLLNLKMDEDTTRSEEHTSELQSRGHLVCRLLLEKKKRKIEKYKPKEKKIKV